MKNIKLNDGTLMPQLGFGTWQLEGQELINTALSAAIKEGYTHIDTAQIYNNEYEIGNFLIKNKIKRESVYLTTKVWISNFRSFDDFHNSVKESLKRLGVDKVNMLLLHWAMSKNVSVKAYQWLEKMHEMGYTDSIGISNFNVERMEQILAIAKIKPAVNQVQFDLINQEHEIINFCQKHNIHVQGYSVLKPYLGNSNRASLSDEQKATVDKIGKSHGKTGAQIILKYTLQKGLIVFPKSKSPVRIKANIDLFDFELAPKEMAWLETMNDQKSIMMHDNVANGEWDSALESPLLYKANFKPGLKPMQYLNDDAKKWDR